MRQITLVYFAPVIFVFGWLTATFGFLPSLLATIILVSPAYFAWRMDPAQRPIERREYCYLAVVSILAVTATGFLVYSWYGAGVDRLLLFDREFEDFRRHVGATPEYESVQLSYMQRKGGRVYLHGSVASKEVHDRLIEDVERMVRSNFSGYFDGVEYPGKTTSAQEKSGRHTPCAVGRSSNCLALR